MYGTRCRAAEARRYKIEREAEQFVEGLKLAKCEEETRHGRWLLKGNWSWAEVVTLSNGIYVGGDIDSVVFQGHPDNYGPRSAVYWMATRSYGLAQEKASRGDTQAISWDREIAREEIVWMRRDKSLSKDAARDIIDLLDGECDQSHFIEALYENQDDCESLNAGEVTAQRVYLATAVLRKLVVLLETQDFRDSARSWFQGSQAA